MKSSRPRDVQPGCRPSVAGLKQKIVRMARSASIDEFKAFLEAHGVRYGTVEYTDAMGARTELRRRDETAQMERFRGM